MTRATKGLQQADEDVERFHDLLTKFPKDDPHFPGEIRLQWLMAHGDYVRALARQRSFEQQAKYID